MQLIFDDQETSPLVFSMMNDLLSVQIDYTLSRNVPGCDYSAL